MTVTCLERLKHIWEYAYLARGLTGQRTKGLVLFADKLKVRNGGFPLRIANQLPSNCLLLAVLLV